MDQSSIKDMVESAANSAFELLADLMFRPIEIKGIELEEHDTGSEFFGELPPELIVSIMDFSGAASGPVAIIALPFDASLFAKLILGEEASAASEQLSPDDMSNFQEAISQAAIAMASKLSGKINSSMLSAVRGTSSGFAEVSPVLGSVPVLVSRISFSLENEESEIILVWEQALLERLEEIASQGAPTPPAPAPVEAGEAVADEELAGMAAEAEAAPDISLPSQEAATWQGFAEEPKATRPGTSRAGSGLSSEDEQNLNLLMDVPLEVTVELGRTKMSIKEVLALSEGTVIQLNRLAGEPVDFLVNGKLISKGEVVVIDENFGIRITEIVSAEERIKNL